MRLSKLAVSRSVERVAAEMGRTNGDRLRRVAGLIGEDGLVRLDVVLDTLYPGVERAAALTSFRQLRQDVAKAASEAEVQLVLESDGQTRTAPAKRAVWFEGQDQVAAAVQRMTEDEIGNPERSPQDAAPAGPFRIFVSYAHKDATQKDKLLGELRPLLKRATGCQIELWTDVDIRTGSDWRKSIQQALQDCHAGLMLVSPEFAASDFIRSEEQSYLLAHRIPVPVLLKPVPMDSTFDLGGIDAKQIFTVKGKAFEDTRKGFALALYQEIHRIVTGHAPAAQPVHERHLLDIIGDFDEKAWTETEGVFSSLDKDDRPIHGRRCDAIESLLEWLQDPKGAPYSALLGEYGMGKTTTCKALARKLLDLRAAGERVPLPIYLDLRLVGERAQRDLDLDQILEAVLKGSWKGGPEGPALTASEVKKLVANQGALVIWDGLDEVLVHLSTNAGQQFTRQLFKIAPPPRREEPRRAWLLLSCRTHFFRTFRDQVTHFRAEDRDSIREEHYRDPLVLLPFTRGQIRRYVERALEGLDPDHVMAVLDSVHNLAELAERPYTLSLIARQFERIERWKAEGRKVTGLTLYRSMVLEWLERDEGKHHFSKDHKLELMEHLAAELWRSGQRVWRVKDVEAWMGTFLRSHADIAWRYQLTKPELLEEDLRTATFLVRDGEDGFRFAHTSLQEYFLSGYLRRALACGTLADLAVPRPSRETLDFLGQWLLEDDERERAVETMGRVRDEYRAGVSEWVFEYVLLSGAKGYPAPSAARFQLPGADLSFWTVEGAGVSLTGINLAGARLWNTSWRDCDLREGRFDGADAARSEWLGSDLRGASWRDADVEAVLFRRCELEGSGVQPSQRTRTYVIGSDTALVSGARPGGTSGHRSAVNACAWSPDGTRIVSGSEDRTLRIWDAKTGKPLFTLRGHIAHVRGCAWSADGTMIVSGSDDATVRIWDAKTGNELATVADHDYRVNGCAWSPDGTRIVSGSDDGTLRVWDAKTGEALATLSGHSGYVRGCSWSPDGTRIVSGSADHTLRIWDVKTGEAVATLSGHAYRVNGCAWSHGGTRIVSGAEDRTLQIWDANTGKALATLIGHSDSVSGCAWSPDETLIVSGSDDGSLRLWDAKTGKAGVTLSGHSNAVRGCAWSPDGTRIVSGSADGTLKIWDAKTGKVLATLSGLSAPALGCAWSPGGLLIASGATDRTVRIWDAKTGRALRTMQGHRDHVRACAWSQDQSRIVSGSWDSTLRIWDVRTGEPLATLSGHDGPVWGCAWSPDGTRIVSASTDQTLRIWDASTGGELRTLRGHIAEVRGCAWSPSGTWIVSASADRTLRIWDAKTGKELRALCGHGDYIRGCAWSPDGTHIVSASADETLRIWDAATGEELQTLRGHGDYVKGCAWSPDGKRIVSGSDDQTLRIWDAKTGKELETLRGHGDLVMGCEWSPDGTRIVSASADGTVRVWGIDGIELLRLYTFHRPSSKPAWASIDPVHNRVIACSEDAWRDLGWLVPDPVTGWEMLPAETFGELPVVAD